LKPVVTNSSCLCIYQSITLGSYENAQGDSPHNLNITSNDDTEHSYYGRESVKAAAAKFILTLKETFKFTQASLDYTVKEFGE